MASSILGGGGGGDAPLSPELELALDDCDSEWQLVACGDIPLTARAERAACCASAPGPPGPPRVAAVVAGAASSAATQQSAGPKAAVARPDLDTSGSYYTAVLEYYLGTCTTAATADMPTFARDGSGQTQVRQRAGRRGWRGGRGAAAPRPRRGAARAAGAPARCRPAAGAAAPPTAVAAPHAHAPSAAHRNRPHSTPPPLRPQMTVVQQKVPTLSKDVIKKIKKAALSAADKTFKQAHSRVRRSNSMSKFSHPGGFAGPLEMAAVVSRTAASVDPQSAAKANLLSGDNVPVVKHGSWSFPTLGTPPDGYAGGPLPMAKVEIDYGARPAGWGGVLRKRGQAGAGGSGASWVREGHAALAAPGPRGLTPLSTPRPHPPQAASTTT
jgi:hypothetical protein